MDSNRNIVCVAATVRTEQQQRKAAEGTVLFTDIFKEKQRYRSPEEINTNQPFATTTKILTSVV